MNKTHTQEISFNTVTKQAAFWFVHLICILVFWVGFSWTAFTVCIALYLIRMFAITGGYHRYFSHRTFKTSRFFQFCLAVLGTTSAQKGPIWWASHHRHHHKHSDTEEDMHSPHVHGVYYSHVGWVLDPIFLDTRNEEVRDLLKFPELVWLEKWNLLPPILLAIGLFFLGGFLGSNYPTIGTSASQMLIWGFFVSTVLLYHGTFCVNSLVHLFGTRRFKTTDDSRNNWFVAIITLGEGWHNNHHRYPGSERQGLYWWEIDISHYVLKFLEMLGLVWDIRTHPERIYKEALEG